MSRRTPSPLIPFPERESKPCPLSEGWDEDAERACFCSLLSLGEYRGEERVGLQVQIPGPEEGSEWPSLFGEEAIGTCGPV